MTTILKSAVAKQVRECVPRVVDLWFEGVSPNVKMPSEAILSRWWGKGRSAAENARFNDECRTKFGPVLDSLADLPVSKHAAQIAKELDTPPTTKSHEAYHYSLGLVLLLDQMPRCIFGAASPSVYTHYDILAQLVSKNALDQGLDAWYNTDSLAWRFWFYLPLEHSEDIKQHERLKHFVDEFAKSDDSPYTKYVIKAVNEHHDIIKEFGRYPYRNSVVGRETSPQEEKWVEEHGNPFATA